jgi:hypothetical protein
MTLYNIDMNTQLAVNGLNSRSINTKYKTMYSLIKADYIQLNSILDHSCIASKEIMLKNTPHKGGYINMNDTMVDSLLRLYNMKLFVSILTKETDDKVSYDALAKYLLPDGKYQNYINTTSTYKQAYKKLMGNKSKIIGIYDKYPVIFDEIYNHYNGTVIVSFVRKRELLRAIGKFFDKDFWKNIEDIGNDILTESIFSFYEDKLTISDSDNVMIVDPNNYILYRNGDVEDTTRAKYFEFTSSKFITINITDTNRIHKLIEYNKREFILDTRNIYTTNMNLQNINIIYGQTTDGIRSLIGLNNVSNEDNLLIKTQSLLPNTNKFLSTIFNIQQGEYTKRNAVIYSMIFADKLQLLLTLISDVLSDRLTFDTIDDVTISELVSTIDHSILDDNEKTVYVLSAKEKLVVDRRLYNIIDNEKCLGSLIKSYNYFYLVTLTNKIEMDTVKREPLNMAHAFLVELKTFLILIKNFKIELLPIIRGIELNVYNNPDDFIKLFVIVYIIHIIREKTNIHINKTKTIDSLLDVRRDMDNTNKGIKTEHVEITRWIGNSSANKLAFKRIREFSGIKVGDQSFHSCGETLTLNLMNYILLDTKSDVFKIPTLASQSIKDFYSKRKTMKDMFIDEKMSVNDWAVLIAGHNKVLYNRSKCELIPSAINILTLFRELIPNMPNISSAGILGLMEFIRSLDGTIIMRTEKDAVFDILILNDFRANFSTKHGMMDVYVAPQTYTIVGNNVSQFKTIFASLVVPLHIIDRLILLNRYDIIQNVVNELSDSSITEKILTSLLKSRDKRVEPIIAKLVTSEYFNVVMAKDHIKDAITQSIANLLLESIRNTDRNMLIEIMLSEVLFDESNKVVASNKVEYAGFQNTNPQYSVNKNKTIAKYFSQLDKEIVIGLISDTNYKARPIYALLHLEKFDDVTNFLQEHFSLKELSSSENAKVLHELIDTTLLTQIITAACAYSYIPLFEYLIRFDIIPIDMFVLFFQNKLYYFATTIILRDLDPATFARDYLLKIYDIRNNITKNKKYEILEYYHNDIIKFISKLNIKLMTSLVIHQEKQPVLACLRMYRPDVVINLLNTDPYENSYLDFSEERDFNIFVIALVELISANKENKILANLIKTICNKINILSIIEYCALQIEHIDDTWNEITIITKHTTYSNALTTILNCIHEDMYHYYNNMIDMFESISNHIDSFTALLFSNHFVYPYSQEYYSHMSKMLNFVFTLTTTILSNDDFEGIVPNTISFMKKSHILPIQQIVNSCRHRHVKYITEELFDFSLIVVLSADNANYYLTKSKIKLLTGIPEAYEFLLGYRYDFLMNDNQENPRDDVVNMIKYLINRDDLGYEELASVHLSTLEKLGHDIMPIIESNVREYTEASWSVLENIRGIIKKNGYGVINSMCHQVLIQFDVVDDTYTYDNVVFDENNKFIYRNYAYEIDHDDYYDNDNDYVYDRNIDEPIFGDPESEIDESGDY